MVVTRFELNDYISNEKKNYINQKQSLERINNQNAIGAHMEWGKNRIEIDR